MCINLLLPYLIKLVTVDIILMLLIFYGKVTTQLMCGEMWSICVQINPDDSGQRITKPAAQLTEISQYQFSLSIYGMSMISKVPIFTE